MLFESDVIRAVTNFLESSGYQIDKVSLEHERGDDIQASKSVPDIQSLVIEAKGETSSKSHTPRYGRRFSRKQIRSHIGKAMFRAAKILTENHGNPYLRVGFAFPRIPLYRELLHDVQDGIARLGIGIFWVNNPLAVEVEPDNSLNEQVEN